MKTIEDAIFERYNTSVTTIEPDLDLLFDIILTYIKEKKWLYDGKESQEKIHTLNEQENLVVNCFRLTDLLIHMAQRIGVKAEDCFAFHIPHFADAKSNEFVEGEYECFSPTCVRNEDGLYEFDVHCIAMINGKCFDVLLQAKYIYVNKGVNVYNSLSIMMSKDEYDSFEELLPWLNDINEVAPVSKQTLLHQAIFNEKFNFALLLLKQGAQDTIVDGYGETALSILNEKLHSPTVSEATLEGAKAYYALTMEQKLEKLQRETKAATTIQTFWKQHRKSTTPAAMSEPIKP